MPACDWRVRAVWSVEGGDLEPMVGAGGVVS
jgi:hypothetical protein